MRLQDFGSSTQEGEFAVMLSDRALGIMEIKSQVNQDEMSSSTSSNSDNTYPNFYGRKEATTGNTSELKGYFHSSDNI